MRIVDKKYHYLYKTTNLINEKYYYGMHSTSNLDDDYLGSGKRLRYSIRKYGKDNFKREIIKMFDTREELIQAEIDLITEELLSEINCMNLKLGGSGGFSIEQQKINAENSNKIQKLLHLNPEWLLNKQNKCREALYKKLESGELKTLYFYNWENKQHSKETKEKMSKSKKGTGIGNTNSQFGTCWITKNNINKKIKKVDLDLYLNDGWFKGRI